MSRFEAKSLCILGRQPALGLAELESLFGAEHIKPGAGFALLDVETGDINFKRLGGTIKVARILNILTTNRWSELEEYLIENVPEHLEHVPEGPFTLGVSAYGLKVQPKVINQSLMNIKRALRPTGRSVRVIPNKAPALNSAQVLHNKLTVRGAWELLFVADGRKTILAQTIFVQDIEAYGARDQARPKRDARVGMLPPKLAQIIINLLNQPARSWILDPFCGTGVILQEAWLMGYSVSGSDIDPRMVEFSKANMRWLRQKFPQADGLVEIEQGDATNHRWKHTGGVASETYLGRPLARLPAASELDKVVRDVNTILSKSLVNLAGQLKAGTPLCLALPAWRTGYTKFKHLPIVDRLTDMGYTYWDLKHARREDLIYYREDQIVARELLRLKKV